MSKMSDKQIRQREFTPHQWNEPYYEERKELNNVNYTSHIRIIRKLER